MKNITERWVGARSTLSHSPRKDLGRDGTGPSRLNQCGGLRFGKCFLGAVMILFNAALAGGIGNAGELPSVPTNAPVSLELRDQYDAPQKLSFPSTNVTILTIADRKGAEQVAGWIAALRQQLGSRVDIRGLANVAAVPGFLQGRVRKSFQQTYRYPVMLDWSGRWCAHFGCRADVANILVIRRDGTIAGRFSGAVESARVKAAVAVAEAELSRETDSLASSQHR